MDKVKYSRLRRATFAVAASCLLIVSTSPVVQADDRQRSEPAKVGGHIYKADPYVITDPALVANPEKVQQALERDGSLDAFGIKSTNETGGKPVMHGASDPPYVVDSSVFPGGSKPDDPTRYRYITSEECDQHAEEASDAAGWLKNRYSYCSKHIVAIPAVRCWPIPFRCEVLGTFVSRNTLIGYGKIGSHPDVPGQRWADFHLSVEVLTATGPFSAGNAEMEAIIECDGDYPVDFGINDGGACHPGTLESREATIPEWRRDGKAHFDLRSEAFPPAPHRNEQIGIGVFHIEYEFDLPGWWVQWLDTESPEGGMRFDSAFYLQWDKQGSVFDRSLPGFSYTKADNAVEGVALHIEQARANPAATVPARPDKFLRGAGTNPDDTLRRLAGAKNDELRQRADRNGDTARAFCRTPEMPAQPPTGGPFDCDEYPFASTYEGAAWYLYEVQSELYERQYSVQWVNSGQNQEAGGRLNAWYETDRLLDGERFFVPIR